jgi:hypothetical protein
VNANEAIMLCRFVKAACPQQAIDEYTPDAWLILLEPFRYEDCKQAAVELARAEPFVAPAEIIAKVKAIRSKRIQDFGPFDPPDGITDYHKWLGDTRRAIADGELTPNVRPINKAEQDRVMRAIEGVFPRIPDDTDPLVETEGDVA